MTQTKIDVTTAGAVTMIGSAGMTLHEMLETGQLVASIAATLLGILYLLWKWAREWKNGKRRDRREGDRPQQ